MDCIIFIAFQNQLIDCLACRQFLLHTNDSRTRVNNNVFITLPAHSEFFQVVAKIIFPSGATVMKFHFTDSKLREKHFSTKM